MFYFAAKPIDLLAHYVGVEDNEDLSVEMQEPYNVLKVGQTKRVMPSMIWHKKV